MCKVCVNMHEIMKQSTKNHYDENTRVLRSLCIWFILSNCMESTGKIGILGAVTLISIYVVDIV